MGESSNATHTCLDSCAAREVGGGRGTVTTKRHGSEGGCDCAYRSMVSGPPRTFRGGGVASAPCAVCLEGSERTSSSGQGVPRSSASLTLPRPTSDMRELQPRPKCVKRRGAHVCRVSAGPPTHTLCPPGAAHLLMAPRPREPTTRRSALVSRARCSTASDTPDAPPSDTSTCEWMLSRGTCVLGGTSGAAAELGGPQRHHHQVQLSTPARAL